MRKLFVVGFISVVVLIGWILFLNYDMKHFEKEHTVATLPQQDSNKDKAGDQSENTNETLENAETPIEIKELKELSESVTSVNNPNTDKSDTSTVVDPDDPQQILTDTRLSPETIKLYKTYRSIAKEMQKYSGEQLAPLQKQYGSLNKRSKEIQTQIRSGNFDQATITLLAEELKEITAAQNEIFPRMFELQNKIREIDEKQTANLKEYGYSSFEEFWNTHWKTYETWESEQTNE